MKRAFKAGFVLSCILLALLCVGNVSGTDVIGRITTDTTWTKAQSPITLTGPLNVNTGVTLTVESGVTVNLNDYYIQVEGTLRAIGTESDKIQFGNGKINFQSSSNGWSQQTGTGNIFENNAFNGVSINAFNSPSIKFNQNTLNGDLTVTGTSIITCNTVVGSITASGSAIVWKNTVKGSITGGGIGTNQQKYTIISCNTVTSGGGYINTGIEAYAYVRIEDNTVSGCNYGIFISTGRDVMGGCVPPNAVIERNRITDCTHGIHAEIYNAMATTSGTPIVKTNSISNNKIGLYVDGWAQCLTLKNNNIEVCSQNRVYLKSSSDLDATQNWWGTTDTSAIGQSIYDSNRDFNLGTVIFEPILTAENPAAYPNENAPMPTPQQSNLPTSTQITQAAQTSPATNPTTTTEPTQPSGQEPIFGSFNLELAIFGALLVVIVLLAVLIALVLKRGPK
jgi:hypothetical protein